QVQGGTEINAPSSETRQPGSEAGLRARIDGRDITSALDPLLHRRRPALSVLAQAHRRPRRDLEPLQPSRPAMLGIGPAAVERPDVDGRVDVVPLARPQLVVL